MPRLREATRARKRADPAPDRARLDHDPRPGCGMASFVWHRNALANWRGGKLSFLRIGSLAVCHCGHQMGVKAASVTLLTCAVLGVASATAAGPTPAPPGLPSVLCQKKTFPGRTNPTTPGSYAYKPRSCRLEAYIKNEGYEASSRLFGIEWREWTADSAAGIGFTPIGVENLETGELRQGRQPVRITLDKALTRCGHRVFSAAHVYWLHAVPINYAYHLHQEPVLGHGCP